MNRRDFLLRSGAAVSLGLLARGSLFAQTSPTATPPQTAPVRAPGPVTEFKPLRRNIGCFTGRGGTIGWLVNAAALVAVDTQFPDTAAICLAGLPGRAGRTLDAVINTHHHFDHTAGNSIFRPATQLLVAHRHVPALQRAAFERSLQQAAAEGRPSPDVPVLPDTLFDRTWRIEAGDEVVSARYFGPAHTGGDIAVHFERANVVHVGDLVFNRLYPVTDRPGGSSALRWLQACEALANTYPADALYIFGHGNPKFGITGSRADVLAQRDYLAALIEHVRRQIAAGQPRSEIVKLTNLPGFPDYTADPKNSRLPGNLGAVYDELTTS